MGPVFNAVRLHLIFTFGVIFHLHHANHNGVHPWMKFHFVHHLIFNLTGAVINVPVHSMNLFHPH